MSGEQMSQNFEELRELALPNSVIKNQVVIFNASVKAWRDAIFAEERAAQYTSRIGATMSELDCGSLNRSSVWKADPDTLRGRFDEKYRELKDRAWTSILRGSQVTSKLSSGAQKRLEAEFERIKSLEFTVHNIYGFLQGIVDSAGEIQFSMLCDVFDQIVRYHSDNVVFYRGWKSNDAHRTCGMRVKTRRFILPGFGMSWGGISWENRRMLNDFDRVFALIDGKAQPEVTLVSLFEQSLDDLKRAQRLSASYFDIRLYNGIGTLHFFPRRADLMDRLNRMVGRHRAWLPPDSEEHARDFWKQYDKAEVFDGELRETIHPLDPSFKTKFGWRGALRVLTDGLGQQSGYCSKDVQEANALVDEACAKVQLNHGIDMDSNLAGKASQLLLAA
jgi:hypothetical protein